MNRGKRATDFWISVSKELAMLLPFFWFFPIDGWALPLIGRRLLHAPHCGDDGGKHVRFIHCDDPFHTLEDGCRLAYITNKEFASAVNEPATTLRKPVWRGEVLQCTTGVTPCAKHASIMRR